MQAAANAAPKLSLYDATTRGSVTVAKKSDQPMDVVLIKIMDSGNKTSILTYNIVNPSDNPNPGKILCFLNLHFFAKTSPSFQFFKNLELFH